MVKDNVQNGNSGVETSNIFEALSSSARNNTKTVPKKKKTLAQKMERLNLSNRSSIVASTVSLASSQATSSTSQKQQVKNSQQIESKTPEAEYKIEVNRQKLLKNNLTLHGIQPAEKENVLQLVRAVFQAIGVNVAERSIYNYYRIKGNNKIILVKLRDHETKMQVLIAKKAIKVGEIMKCDEDEAKTPISIDEHLTPYFGRLLAEGRKAYRQGYIKSCWFDSYTCQAMCTIDGKSLAFKNVDELDKIVAEVKKSLV